MARRDGRAYRRFAEPHRPGRARAGKDERHRPSVHAAGWLGEGSPGPVLAEGILAAVKGIADTGFLVAFANRSDRHHEWAVQVAGHLTEPLLTCEAVLAEAAFHLQDSALVLSMLRE